MAETLCNQSTSINDLPDELLQQILFNIDPQDILRNVSRISKKFNRLANEPLLWRHRCSVNFKYWDSKHRIRQKNAESPADCDWKRLFIYRTNVDEKATTILDEILANQSGRIEKFEQMDEFGYDAKDVLLRHCQTADSADDVLARRYYSNAVLDHLHRTKAVELWAKIRRGETIPPECALGAYDLFILHDQHGDLDEISEILDNLFVQMQQEWPNISTSTTRQKALAAAQFLRFHDLTGVSSERAYRDLQNNYIGIALQDPNHPSLPLISVVIYCALAQRLGVDARCCGFPHHVHAIVFAPQSETLDGKPQSAITEEPEVMYLDPFRSDTEVPVEYLRSQLSAFGVHPIDYSNFLRESKIDNILLRTSRNILATVHRFRGPIERIDDEINGYPTIRLHANPFADMDNAFYSALWVNFMLAGPRMDGNHQRQFLPMLLERFEQLFSVDAGLFERYVCPPFQRSGENEHLELFETIRLVRAEDSAPKKVSPRDSRSAREKVLYRVGQVFHHKRYGYTGVITGWDVACGMDSTWIERNGVDRLQKGRHQSFYHALVEDTSICYVAEENITIIEPELPVSLMSLAGRYFKRWNRETHRFISNVRDEYPDD